MRGLQALSDLWVYDRVSRVHSVCKMQGVRRVHGLGNGVLGGRISEADDIGRRKLKPWTLKAT